MRSKIIIAALLCAVIPLGTAELPSGVPVSLSAEAATVIDSGTCGKNVTWQLDSSGTLTVSGTGEMYGQSDDTFPVIPWNEKKDLIKKVVIGKGITKIGRCNFTYCNNLVSVTFPDTLKTIGEGNFIYCTALTSVVIPDSVTTIEGSNFSGCKNLADITIPSSAKVEGGAFYGTAWEKDQLEKSPFVIVNGTLLTARVGIEKAAIPDGVVCIARQAFYYKSKMTELVIPDSVKEIQFNAFIGCSSLRSVTIPKSVEEISYQAFYECEALEEINILNPECYIRNDAKTISNTEESYSGVIRGYAGSTAEAYAKKYGRTFERVDQGVGLINDYSGDGSMMEEFIPGIVIGDVNDDGMVDAVDASDVLAYYARVSTEQEGGFSKKQQIAADVDMNGLIDSVDASDILSYYAYLSTAGGTVPDMVDYLEKK